MILNSISLKTDGKANGKTNEKTKTPNTDTQIFANGLIKLFKPTYKEFFTNGIEYNCDIYTKTFRNLILSNDNDVSYVYNHLIILLSHDNVINVEPELIERDEMYNEDNNGNGDKYSDKHSDRNNNENDDKHSDGNNNEHDVLTRFMSPIIKRYSQIMSPTDLAIFFTTKEISFKFTNKLSLNGYIPQNINSNISIMRVDKDIRKLLRSPRVFFNVMKKMLKFDKNTGYYSIMRNGVVIPVICKHEYMLLSGQTLIEVATLCSINGKCMYCDAPIPEYDKALIMEQHINMMNISTKLVNTIIENNVSSIGKISINLRYVIANKDNIIINISYVISSIIMEYTFKNSFKDSKRGELKHEYDAISYDISSDNSLQINIINNNLDEAIKENIGDVEFKHQNIKVITYAYYIVKKVLDEANINSGKLYNECSSFLTINNVRTTIDVSGVIKQLLDTHEVAKDWIKNIIENDESLKQIYENNCVEKMIYTIKYQLLKLRKHLPLCSIIEVTSGINIKNIIITINRFEEVYKKVCLTFCPVNYIHLFTNNVCKYCGLKKDSSNSIDIYIKYEPIIINGQQTNKMLTIKSMNNVKEIIGKDVEKIDVNKFSKILNMEQQIISYYSSRDNELREVVVNYLSKFHQIDKNESSKYNPKQLILYIIQNRWCTVETIVLELTLFAIKHTELELGIYNYSMF